MRTTTYLTALLVFFASVPTCLSQYKIDWKNAPLNPNPSYYTANHNNLAGNVFQVQYNYESGDVIYEYDAKGNLIKSIDDILGNTQYYYDANGFVNQIQVDGIFAYTSYLTTNNKGVVLQEVFDDGSGSTFQYDNNGLWVSSQYLDTKNIKQRNTYDSKKRIIKIENYNTDGTLSSTSNYTYEKIGNILKANTKTWYQYNNETSTYEYFYNEKGLSMSSAKNTDVYGYDEKGNYVSYRNTLAGTNEFRTILYQGQQGNLISNTVSKPNSTIQTPVNNTTVASTGCVLGDCQNGWGKWQFDNGYYEGFWVNGKRTGYGMYLWPGTGKYIGNWQNDQMSGYGEYLAENDDNIIGQYANGNLNGIGYTVLNDVWSQGIYTNGNLSTPYSFSANGATTGCTAGDCQNGYGQMKWSNGDFYSGFFSNGSLSMGTYEFGNGDKYYGTYNSQNQLHGFGRYYYKDGRYYGGEWSNGQQHGKGYLLGVNITDKQIGEWSNGSLVRNMGY